MSEVRERALEALRLEMKVADLSSEVGRAVVPMEMEDELVRVAELVGLDVESYMYRAVRRVLEKCAVGIPLDDAVVGSGLKLDEFMGVVDGCEDLRELYLGLRHGWELRTMVGVNGAIEKGDGKLGLEVIGRQVNGLAPAKQRVEVNRVIDIRVGQSDRIIDA